MKTVDYNLKLLEERDKFETHLTTHGLRLSSGRMKVFSIIMETHGHFAAEEIVKICKEKKVKVSRATIYRTMQELLESGVIRATAFGEKHQHYEHVYDEQLHHHARCIKCNHNIEFPDKKEDDIYRPFLEKQGFKILGHEMYFYGICKPCVKKGQKS